MPTALLASLVMSLKLRGVFPVPTSFLAHSVLHSELCKCVPGGLVVTPEMLLVLVRKFESRLGEI